MKIASQNANYIYFIWLIALPSSLNSKFKYIKFCFCTTPDVSDLQSNQSEPTLNSFHFSHSIVNHY